MSILTAGNTVYPLDVAKVLISIPDDLLRRIDEYAQRTAETRSGFLQRLAESELAADDARRRKEFEKLLEPTLPPGTDAAQMIREERDNDHWH
jgi:oligoribonuclease (3'-5' exoribonuclease)